MNEVTNPFLRVFREQSNRLFGPIADTGPVGAVVNGLSDTVMGGINSFIDKFKSSEGPLALLKGLDGQLSGATGITDAAKNDAMIKKLQETAGMPAELAKEAVKKFRADPNITNTDFGKHLQGFGASAGLAWDGAKKWGMNAWGQATAAVGAATTAVTAGAAKVAAKPIPELPAGQYWEDGKDGKPVIFDTTKVDPRPVAESAPAPAVVAPSSVAPAAVAVASPVAPAPSEAHVMVVAPSVTVVFVPAATKPASESPRMRIYTDPKQMASAETDGVPKRDISSSSRFVGAVTALQQGKTLDEFQEKALNILATQVGAKDRAELERMLVKPNESKPATSVQYDPSLNAPALQSP